MKALITGAAGFIGFHTARRLVEQGWEVWGVDSYTDYYEPELKRQRVASLPNGARVEYMDIARHEPFRAYVNYIRPDVVIHLAAQAGVRYSIENPFAYAHANLTGHLSVLEACRHCESVGHLVYASSSSVYGGNTEAPFKEEHSVDQPVSLYAATKRADELMSSTYAHLYGLQQIGLRFFTVYGEWGRPDMAYWSFTKRILAGETIRVFNHGDMRRDFTYVDDIVTGVVATATQTPVFAQDERPHRVYNIGAHRPTNLMDFIHVLEDKIGRKAEIQFEPMQPGDVYETYADVENLRRDYGFAPETRIEDGLERFVTWYRAHFGV